MSSSSQATAALPMLSIQRASVRFGGVVAVNQVSLDVQQGELLGLLGPNGAGKTTLLKLISGVVAPNSGDIRLHGQSLNRLGAAQRAQRGIALSHQIVRPFRGMSLLDNVVLAAGKNITRTPLRALTHIRHSSIKFSPLHDKGMDYLKQVGIDHLADRLPSTQPLGVLKRLEVARAMATQPSLLLLDEPLAGLGHVEAVALADLIVKLNQSGTTIVLIEHNLSEVLRICPRIAVLNNGVKMADDAAAVVMRDPAVIEAYLGAGADVHALEDIAHVAH